MGDAGSSKPMVAQGSGQRQPSKEEVQAALLAFKQELEAGGAVLGQNEEGEEFVEITEEWDDTVHVRGDDGAAPAAAAAPDDVPDELEDVFGDEEEFDVDEFEAMMTEMEKIELEAAATAAAAAAVPAKKPGIKKGFLLGGGGIDEKKDEKVVEKPAAVREEKSAEKTAAASGPVPPRPLQTFAVGDVVERQPEETETSSMNVPPAADPQQRVSRFKMRHMTAGS